jgi:two-component system, NtrC family, sensor histidine kinase GlrK
MRIGYHTSFLKLLLFGFLLAILPLIVAFINANLAFNQLTKQSQQTIRNAVETTRASHILQEQLNLMERSARQFFVLYDDELLQHYTQSRSGFIEAMTTLNHYTDHQTQLSKLSDLKINEIQLHHQIFAAIDENQKKANFLDQFQVLNQQAKGIIHSNNLIIDQVTSHLVSVSKSEQQRFFMQSLILIPIALFVIGLITVMVARPIKRMDTAIARLGKGEYQTSLQIEGPGNLSILGQRLEWLRIELLELKTQKQKFLQHISHELKTPLTAIREAAELLYDEVGGKLTSQQQEISFILRENSIRLQKMIENLLTFTRLESGKVELKLESTPIAELIDRVLMSHALSIRNKQLTIHQDYQLATITGDADKLITIFDNLISNAIKFTPINGRISLICRSEKKWQVIEVIDNGPGLTDEDKSKLFDPFHQGKTVHQGLVNSTGLGLAVTRDLVEAHQGVIDLIHSSVGAHFVVRLPQLGPL